MLAVFRHVGAGEQAERRADGDAEGGHDQRADDGVEQAARGAGRRRHLGEDVEVEAGKTVPQQGAEDQGEGGEPEDGRGDARRPWRWRCAPCGWLARDSQRPSCRLSRASISREAASTKKVMMNSSRPSAISEEV